MIVLAYLFQLRREGFDAPWQQLVWELALAVNVILVLVLTTCLVLFWRQLTVRQRWGFVWTIVMV